jgi:hypothetical protein
MNGWITIGMLVFLLGLCLSAPMVVLADGGNPSSTPSVFPAATPTRTPAGGQSSTFEIIIAPSASPVVNRLKPNPLEPDGGQSASQPQPQALPVEQPGDDQQPPEKQEFESPLWLFFFVFVVLMVVMLNAITNRIRQRRSP